MSQEKKKLFLLIIVVFSTSLTTALSGFSLKKGKGSLFPKVIDSGGSVLSQAKTKEIKENQEKTKETREKNRKEVLIKTKQTLNSNKVSLEEKAEEAVFHLTDVLKENQPSLIYDFLGEDIKTVFTEDDFLQSSFSFPEIKKTEIFSGPRVFGKWSEFTLKLTLEDQSEKDYLVVFHFEDGKWKLFGTQEVF